MLWWWPGKKYRYMDSDSKQLLTWSMAKPEQKTALCPQLTQSVRYQLKSISGIGDLKIIWRKSWIGVFMQCLYCNNCYCLCVQVLHCMSVYLECGQYNLLHRVEVGLPQELGLLSQGQDLILVNGAHCWGDLGQRWTHVNTRETHMKPVCYTIYSHLIHKDHRL